ncbi:class I adenylate-forming enzyme family protein [Streptomyces griseoloalbus]|uniref:Bile acid-coenzyme A ligase n=1 Tax=Streptomyces griseoloalbus TaxID=67303 RepID=A0A7W8BWH7_9ACTN|nr:AMP-binding protein [Streptomyces albaduncus]MBB5130242.1 bile acid-coenzyme A ligase [Streptomyces albaduncus]
MSAEPPLSGPARTDDFSLRRAWDGAGASAIAIAHLRSGTRVTFGDLEARVSSAARQLRTRAASHGLAQPVVVHEAHDEIATLVTVLAAARAGLGVCLVRAGTWAATSQRLCSQLVAAGFDGVLREGMLATRSERAPQGDPGAWRLLLHSGGTTGRPKLIRLDLSPAALSGMQRLYRRAGWHPGSHQLGLLPLHHAAGLIPALTGLLGGGRLTVTGRAFDPDDVLDVIAAQSVEWLCTTPTHLRLLALADGFATADLGTLHGVLHTAAACDHETKRRWIERIGETRVHEFYSSTEQVGLTFCSGREWTQRPGTVGKGYLTRVSVRDADGRPVPAGTVGEVYMRSLSHARNSAPGVRRTSDGYCSVGDRGYLDAAGYLFLVGRDGDMFTVGGENVYPAELESAILQVPGVLDVMVRPRSHGVLGSIAEALVVADDPTKATASAIKTHCRRILPPASRPHVLSFVEALPRTEVGKLKRLSTDDH